MKVLVDAILLLTIRFLSISILLNNFGNILFSPKLPLQISLQKLVTLLNNLIVSVKWIKNWTRCRTATTDQSGVGNYSSGNSGGYHRSLIYRSYIQTQLDQLLKKRSNISPLHILFLFSYLCPGHSVFDSSLQVPDRHGQRQSNGEHNLPQRIHSQTCNSSLHHR